MDRLQIGFISLRIVTNYKYDKVSMTIKDEKHNIVGELNKMTKIIDMKDEDGNKKTYIEIK